MGYYARILPIAYHTGPTYTTGFVGAGIALAATGSMTWTPVTAAFECMRQGSVDIPDDSNSYYWSLIVVALIAAPVGTVPYNFRWRDITNSVTVLEWLVTGVAGGARLFGPIATLPAGDARIRLEYWSTVDMIYYASFLQVLRLI